MMFVTFLAFFTTSLPLDTTFCREHSTEGIGGDTFLNDWEDTHIHTSSLHSLHAIDLGLVTENGGKGGNHQKAGGELLVSNNLCNLAFSKYLGVDGGEIRGLLDGTR